MSTTSHEKIAVRFFRLGSIDAFSEDQTEKNAPPFS